MTWATTLAWALKHWKLIVWLVSTGVLLLALTVTKAEKHHFQKLYTAEKTANDMLAQTFRAASEKARADAEADARAKEQHYAQVQEEQAHAYETKLSDARARLAQWVRDHQGNSGAAGGTDLPRPAEAAGATAGAGENALVPVTDLDTCAVNTTKAQAWLEWWSAVSGNEKEGK